MDKFHDIDPITPNLDENMWTQATAKPATAEDIVNGIKSIRANQQKHEEERKRRITEWGCEYFAIAPRAVIEADTDFTKEQLDEAEKHPQGQVGIWSGMPSVMLFLERPLYTCTNTASLITY